MSASAKTLAGASSHRPRRLKWSGRTWSVRPKIASSGPGPNAWNDVPRSAEVDSNGYLHLRLWSSAGTWQSVEVEGPHLGYGQYTWVVGTNPAGWDIKPVLGLFTYDDTDDGSHGYRELDIEFSLWNWAPEPSRCWYSNQPTEVDAAAVEPRVSDHALDAAIPYTCTIIWEPGQVYYRTTDTNGKVLGEHVCTDAVQAPGGETIRMNLWLQGGAAPTDGQPLEVVIRSFAFTPSVTHSLVAASDTAFTFSDGTPGALTLKNGAAIVSNQLQLACVSGDYSLAFTGAVFDLAGSSVDLHVVQIPSLGTGTTEALWMLRYDAANYLAMFVSGGGFYARLRQAGVNTQSTLPTYDPVAHRYWRIRESGGTVHFETSPDRSTWTDQYSHAHMLAALLATLRARFECGYFGTETSPDPFIVGAINAD